MIKAQWSYFLSENRVLKDFWLLCNVITNNNKSRLFRKIFDNSSQSPLGIKRHMICFIQNNDFIIRTLETPNFSNYSTAKLYKIGLLIRIFHTNSCSIFFDLFTYFLNTSIIRSIQLQNPIPIKLIPNQFNPKKPYPKSSLAKAKIMEVFPVPGGPYNNRCGISPVFKIPLKALTASSWKDMSFSVFGRLIFANKKIYYFSTHGFFSFLSCATLVTFSSIILFLLVTVTKFSIWSIFRLLS